jgi:hypothetical protein
MRLLVIEDDYRIANLLRQGLEEEGYQVVVASDGQSGLELGQMRQFDVVILDLMLPRLDGYDGSFGPMHWRYVSDSPLFTQRPSSWHLPRYYGACSSTCRLLLS